MPPRKPEQFRTLYCDPGEDFGWCLGKDLKLLAGGTEKMWTQVDDIWDLINNPDNPDNAMNMEVNRRDEVAAEDNTGPIGRVVCENFRLYPWKLHDLKWDEVRTARAIGAITFMCRLFDIPLVLQPAAIKEAARAAGAEELYWRPLHENRHQNDALQHYVFFTNTELMGLNLPVPNDKEA